MKGLFWLKQIENKYYHLLVVLVIFFFIVPLGLTREMRYLVFPVMFLSSILFSLRALEVRMPVFLLVASTGIIAFILTVLFEFFKLSAAGCFLHEVPLLVYALFLLMSIVLLISKMFSASKVNTDTIAGGISVYLLFGFLWTIFYYAIYLFDQKAFNFPSQFNASSLFYFSFSTLTTVGFGDIYPVNKLAMSLSNLEAIVGQMYIAIFISRLVGLHISTTKK